MKKTKEQISYNMSRVRNEGSKIEIMLQQELWARGLRYRKHVKNINGKPDLAFISAKVAVFCDSEFWHGYDWINRRNDFKSNKEFWLNKIERNIERDREVTEALELAGWKVIRFWGKDIKQDVKRCADIVEAAVRGCV